MTRSRQSFVSRVVSTGAIALLLLGAPCPLAAQEGGLPRAQASAFGWLVSVWSELTAWLALDVDGGPSVDPDGSSGGMAPRTPPESVVDGTCSVDPNGCPDGQ